MQIKSHRKDLKILISIPEIRGMGVPTYVSLSARVGEGRAGHNYRGSRQPIT
jgi:hypothetical protein